MNKIVVNNSVVLESLGLPIFHNIETLAQVTRLTPELIYFLSNDELEGRYHSFTIPKRDGSERSINAPCASLKVLQRWVLENILYKIKVSKYSYGFCREEGSPLLRCASAHKDHLFVMKMDIQNFYPSIVYFKVLQQFKKIGYGDSAARLLTNICTHKKALPQGAVTSAYLANIVCIPIDRRISGYCNKHRITYTRYADDLTFSSDNRVALRRVRAIVIEILGGMRFHLNEKKTRFLSPISHKEVLGVTINDGLAKASKDMKRKVRAMIYHQFITADYSHNDQIRGYVSYIDSIEKGYKEKIIAYLTKLSEKELSIFPDVVEAFNAHKLYPDKDGKVIIPDMKLKTIKDFCNAKDDDDLYMAYQMLVEYRDNYLAEHGILEVESAGKYNV